MLLTDECGVNVFALNYTQNISTPEYPLQYRSNLFCNWTITSLPHHVTKLEPKYISNETCCEKLEVGSFNHK